LCDPVLDEGSFVSWDSTPLAIAADDAYARDLAAASTGDGSLWWPVSSTS
jgi:acyl-CoA carboxylase subunit beta